MNFVYPFHHECVCQMLMSDGVQNTTSQLYFLLRMCETRYALIICMAQFSSRLLLFSKKIKYISPRQGFHNHHHHHHHHVQPCVNLLLRFCFSIIHWKRVWLLYTAYPEREDGSGNDGSGNNRWFICRHRMSSVPDWDREPFVTARAIWTIHPF